MGWDGMGWDGMGWDLHVKGSERIKYLMESELL